MFKISIQINRPSRRVFDYLADIESAPEWYSAVQQVTKLSAGSVARGTRFSFVRGLGGRQLDNTVEVCEFKEGTVITLTSVAGPTPFKYRYRVEAMGANTLLHLEGDISGDGMPKLVSGLAPTASLFFEQGMKANLQRLKTIVENSVSMTDSGGPPTGDAPQ